MTDMKPKTAAKGPGVGKRTPSKTKGMTSGQVLRHFMPKTPKSRHALR